MSATIELQDDAGNPITSANFGAVSGGDDQAIKFTVKNVGDQTATSVLLSVARLASNDGIDFVSFAEDVGGNPGSYVTSTINIGDLAADASVDIWVKVTVPLGSTPAGNPRQFNFVCDYSGV